MTDTPDFDAHNASQIQQTALENRKALAQALYELVMPHLDDGARELVDIMAEDRQWAEIISGLTNAAKVLSQEPEPSSRESRASTSATLIEQAALKCFEAVRGQASEEDLDYLEGAIAAEDWGSLVGMSTSLFEHVNPGVPSSDQD